MLSVSWASPVGGQRDVRDRADRVAGDLDQVAGTIWLAFSNTARTVYGVPPDSTMTATAAIATPTAARAATLPIRLDFRTDGPAH